MLGGLLSDGVLPELGWSTVFQLALLGVAAGGVALVEAEDEVALSVGRVNEGGGANAGVVLGVRSEDKPLAVDVVAGVVDLPV